MYSFDGLSLTTCVVHCVGDDADLLCSRSIVRVSESDASVEQENKLPEYGLDEHPQGFDVNRCRKDFTEIDLQPTNQIAMELLPFGFELADSVSFVRKRLFVEGEVSHGESKISSFVFLV